jgi:hypothetical protein
MSAKLRLSAQRALVGQVTPDIRRIYIRHRPGYVELLAVLHGEIPDAARERMEEVTSEIVSDFPDIDLIVANCIRIDAPGAATLERDTSDLSFDCVFGRAED